MNKRTFQAAAISAIVLLGGCAQSIATGGAVEKGPVGSGSGVDQLKGSPCACVEINQSIPFYMKSEAA